MSLVWVNRAVVSKMRMTGVQLLVVAPNFLLNKGNRRGERHELHSGNALRRASCAVNF